MPASGRSGKPVSRRTGRAIILPALVRDGASSGTYKNLPSGDQADGHTRPLPQIRRGSPPSVGTAVNAAVSPGLNTGVIASSQRRSGEIPRKVLIGYGTTFDLPEPSLFI